MQIPRTCQCLLMSATTSEDVQRLQQLVLHNPTVIDCTDHGSEANDMAGSNAAGTSSQIQHFSIQCDRSAPAGHHSSVVYAFLSCVVMLIEAAQDNTWLLIKLTLRGVVFSFLFICFLFFSFLIEQLAAFLSCCFGAPHSKVQGFKMHICKLFASARVWIEALLSLLVTYRSASWRCYHLDTY